MLVELSHLNIAKLKNTSTINDDNMKVENMQIICKLICYFSIQSP